MTQSHDATDPASPFDPGDWPAADTEAAPACRVCGGTRRERWLDGLTDRIFRAAPGRWTLWRCLDCGAATLDPRPTPASIGRAYSRYYTHAGAEKHFLVPGDRPDLRFKRAMHLSFYNRHFGHRHADALPFGWLLIAASRWRSVRAGHYIRHLPGPAPGARLLDVGCGDGGFLRVARAMGYEAQGLEFDPAAAAPARARGFTVHEGTVDAAPLAPGSFDQVTLNHVIEHLHEPAAVLARLRAALKPGGRIWLQTPNVASRGAQRYGADWRGLEPPRHLVLFGERSLHLALERAGFERAELLPPQLDAAFYIGQSESIRAGREPYAADKALRRAARREGRAWDRAALDDPAQAESLTMVAWRPG